MKFVTNFTQDGTWTPIEIVQEICGITYDEIINSKDVFDVVDSDDLRPEKLYISGISEPNPPEL